MLVVQDMDHTQFVHIYIPPGWDAGWQVGRDGVEVAVAHMWLPPIPQNSLVEVHGKQAKSVEADDDGDADDDDYR